jgi:hypothetical protein
MNRKSMQCAIAGAFAGLLLSHLAPAQDTLLVWTNASPAAPYNTWETAFTNIQHAIDYASPGDRVLVTDGVYSVASAIVLGKAVTVESASGPGATMLSLSQTVTPSRVISVSSSNAVLDGFTIMNGYLPAGYGGGVHVSRTGLVQNCFIVSNHANYGGGAYVGTNATLRNCLLQGNVAREHGGGCYLTAGLLEACVVKGNSMTIGGAYGGGISLQDVSAKMRNCLVLRNTSGRHAGGVYLGNGLVENCTIVQNRNGSYTGGGLHQIGGLARNTIVCHNYGLRSTFPNWYRSAGTAQTNCVPDQELLGAGNLREWPRFVNAAADDYRLAPGSPCIDYGNTLAWMEDETDLDGAARLSGQPDLGCYEVNPGPLRAGLWAAQSSALVPASVVFTATADGTNLAGLVYAWDFDNNGTTDLEGANLAVATGSYTTAQWWSPSLSVSNAAGETAGHIRPNFIKTGPAELFVDKAGAHLFPFDSWSSASTSIQFAVNAAVNGSIVWVTNGVYTNQPVALTNAIILAGVNGPAVTIVKSSNARPLTIGLDSAQDGNVPLETVVKGITWTRQGTGNIFGPAAFGGLITDCVISNFAGDPEHLVKIENGAAMTDCLIADNKAARQGVMSVSELWNFTLRTSVVERCVFLRNNQSSESWSSGTYGRSSAGVAVLGRGIVRNCLFRENTSTNRPCAAYIDGGLVESCTFVNNVAQNPIGSVGGILVTGTTASVVRNCLFWGNSNKVTGATDDYLFHARTNSTIQFSRLTPAADLYGGGNITGEPLFRNAATNDFRLQIGSPGWNAGTNLDWMASGTDLDGNPRRKGPAVEMGAFESEQPRAGGLFLLR